MESGADLALKFGSSAVVGTPVVGTAAVGIAVVGTAVVGTAAASQCVHPQNYAYYDEKSSVSGTAGTFLLNICLYLC